MVSAVAAAPLHARLGWAAPVLAILAVSLAVFVVTRPGRGDAEVTVAERPVRDVFLRDCAICHGADGRGTSKAPTLATAGEAGVDYELSTGRMPLPNPTATPERSTPKYSPQRIRELVDYVTTLTGNRKPLIPHPDLRNADVATGARLYQLNCAACHASTGIGGALFHRAAPSVKPATPVQAAEAIRFGPNQMPAFGQAALSNHERDSVVKYVEYLKDPTDRGGWPLGYIGPLAEGAAIIVFGLGPLLLATRWIGTRR